MKPQISILMANYNKEKYVSEAIHSVLKQSDPRWELIIVDDFSQDQSMKIIKEFTHSDRRIKVYRNEKNCGTAYTQDKLVKLASAPIVGILDSDDALTEDAVRIILEAYKNNPEYGFIYSQFAYTDENLQIYKTGECSSIPKGQSNLVADCVSHFKTFRRELYSRTEGYRADLSPAEDMDIVLKLEEITSLNFVNEVLYLYRMLPSSYSHGNKRAEKGRLGYLTAVAEAYLRRKGTKVKSMPKYILTTRLIEGLYLALRLKDYVKFKLLLKVIWA